jgi:hypothetical protein
MDDRQVAIFRPRGVVPRIARQGGQFTVQGNPAAPVESHEDAIIELHRIIIDRDYRATLRSELSHYGVNSATLFPDLDGLSEFVNWTIRSREYWGLYE